MESLPTIRPYEGTLSSKSRKNPKLKQAYQGFYCFMNQRARSKALGLPPPAYTAREFVSWWLSALVGFDGRRPSCGRLDHSKGYSFDNIEMQEMADNAREGLVRNQSHLKTKMRFGKRVLSFDHDTGEILLGFPSILDAARHFGVSQRLTQFVLRGALKKSKKIGFGLFEVAA